MEELTNTIVVTNPLSEKDFEWLIMEKQRLMNKGFLCNIKKEEGDKFVLYRNIKEIEKNDKAFMKYVTEQNKKRGENYG